MSDDHLTPDGGLPPKDWPQPPQLDCDTYRHELRDLGLSTEEENQVLAALWHIVCALVDLGFGMDAASMVIPAMIHNPIESDENELESANNIADTKSDRKQQKGHADE